MPRVAKIPHFIHQPFPLNTESQTFEKGKNDIHWILILYWAEGTASIPPVPGRII